MNSINTALLVMAKPCEESWANSKNVTPRMPTHPPRLQEGLCSFKLLKYDSEMDIL